MEDKTCLQTERERDTLDDSHKDAFIPLTVSGLPIKVY